MRGTRYHGQYFVQVYTTIIDHLVHAIEDTIEYYKSLIPGKAKRPGIPHVLWIAPPNHKYFHDSSNQERTEFATCLQTVVSRFRNMTTLKLVKVWDPQDGKNFLQEKYRFTSKGLFNYWSSVDSAIRFWDVALSRKIDKANINSLLRNNKAKNKKQNNRFKWTKEQRSRQQYP